MVINVEFLQPPHGIRYVWGRNKVASRCSALSEAQFALQPKFKPCLSMPLNELHDLASNILASGLFDAFQTGATIHFQYQGTPIAVKHVHAGYVQAQSLYGFYL